MWSIMPVSVSKVLVQRGCVRRAATRARRYSCWTRDEQPLGTTRQTEKWDYRSDLLQKQRIVIVQLSVMHRKLMSLVGFCVCKRNILRRYRYFVRQNAVNEQ